MPNLTKQQLDAIEKAYTAVLNDPRISNEEKTRYTDEFRAAYGNDFIDIHNKVKTKVREGISGSSTRELTGGIEGALNRNEDRDFQYTHTVDDGVYNPLASIADDNLNNINMKRDVAPYFPKQGKGGPTWNKKTVTPPAVKSTVTPQAEAEIDEVFEQASANDYATALKELDAGNAGLIDDVEAVAESEQNDEIKAAGNGGAPEDVGKKGKSALNNGNALAVGLQGAAGIANYFAQGKAIDKAAKNTPPPARYIDPIRLKKQIDTSATDAAIAGTTARASDSVRKGSTSSQTANANVTNIAANANKQIGANKMAAFNAETGLINNEITTNKTIEQINAEKGEIADMNLYDHKNSIIQARAANDADLADQGINMAGQAAAMNSENQWLKLEEKKYEGGSQVTSQTMGTDYTNPGSEAAAKANLLKTTDPVERAKLRQRYIDGGYITEDFK